MKFFDSFGDADSDGLVNAVSEASAFARAVAARVLSGGVLAADLPSVLAQCCVETCPSVAGAVLTATSWLRIPVGSSDRTAALAERLEVVLGEGGRITNWTATQATADGEIADRRFVLRRSRWAFATPYRAAMTFYADLAGWRGDVRVYTANSAGVPASTVQLLRGTVVPLMAELLADPAVIVDEIEGPLPVWFLGEAARRRVAVWMCVEALTRQRTGLTAEEALAELRGRAHRLGCDLESVAEVMLGSGGSASRSRARRSS